MSKTFLVVLTLLSSLTFAVKGANASTISNLELETITSTHSVIELQRLMDEGRFSAQRLTAFYIDKIKNKNHQYNAIITLNPNALNQAVELDNLRKKGKQLGLLHGIPVIVKDNIETLNMPTTAGSLALKDNFTKRDAPLIQNLKANGAIILAKANLSEWANFRSERSSSGWSAVGGQTKNPHDVTRSTCGSSSGSGAAIAANFAVAAVGTETDGSITCPASATGIVGIKPQLGVISQQGVVPIAHTQDTAGPMTKSVVDAAIMLNAMADKPLTEDKLLNHLSQPMSLSDLTLGVLNSPATNHEQVSNLFKGFLTKLNEQDVNLTEELNFEPYNELYGDEYSVLLYEFKNDLNSYLASLPNRYNQLTLEKLIEFNSKNKAEQMPYFQQEIFELANKKGSLQEKEYKEQLAKIKKATREDGIDELFTEHQLDALISVTLGPSWKIDKVNGDHYPGGISTYSAVSGYPHITIPLGKVHGLPIGLSIIGNKDSDYEMIKIARQLETLLK